MLDFLASSTEWLQQHAVHLLLRRNFAHLFEDPLDFAQLQVQLGRHEMHAGMRWTARINNVRISTAALSDYLVRTRSSIFPANLASGPGLECVLCSMARL
jgi:hypothetical protein